jgi:hypothetical protein
VFFLVLAAFLCVSAGVAQRMVLLFLLVTGHRSLGMKVSDTTVYEPQLESMVRAAFVLLLFGRVLRQSPEMSSLF